jgi:hypothetical protein
MHEKISMFYFSMGGHNLLHTGGDNMQKTVISELLKYRKQCDKALFRKQLNTLRDIKSLLSSMFQHQETEIFITNLDRVSKLKEKKYCLILEKNNIEMITKTLFNKTVRRLDLITLDYTVNGEQASVESLDKLFDMVHCALSGLEKGLATAYMGG